ncbi:2-acylglycerol O-acyltransferase 2 [Chamberlinius hualienensis]
MAQTATAKRSTLGIEFAPLNIPFKRRLQTAAIVHWSTTFLFGGVTGIFLCIFLLFTPFFFLPVLYLTWMWYDRNTCHNGGRRWLWVRNWTVWKLFRDYFPIRLVKTAEFDPKKNYICGYHPHGILSAGAFCNFATEGTQFSKIFPGITSHLITLTGNFWFPLLREYVQFTGACASSKESFEYILTKKGKGNAIFVVVGGAAEALDARPNHIILTLKNRKGFIKLAIRCGADLVPVISFGENDIFNQANNPEGSWLRSFQTKFKNVMGFSPPIIVGRGIFQYTFGLMPFRRPIHTVVGKPIEVVQESNPSNETIGIYHKKYMDSLQQLFDEYKVKLGDDYKNLNLTIH